MHALYLTSHQPDTLARSRRAAERFALETAIKQQRVHARAATRHVRSITITVPFVLRQPGFRLSRKKLS